MAGKKTWILDGGVDTKVSILHTNVYLFDLNRAQKSDYPRLVTLGVNFKLTFLVLPDKADNSWQECFLLEAIPCTEVAQAIIGASCSENPKRLCGGAMISGGPPKHQSHVSDFTASSLLNANNLIIIIIISIIICQPQQEIRQNIGNTTTLLKGTNTRLFTT